MTDRARDIHAGFDRIFIAAHDTLATPVPETRSSRKLAKLVVARKNAVSLSLARRVNYVSTLSDLKRAITAVLRPVHAKVRAVNRRRRRLAFRKFLRRHRAFLQFLASLAVLIGIGIAVFIWRAEILAFASDLLSRFIPAATVPVPAHRVGGP